MSILKKITLLLLFSMVSILTFAQEKPVVAMADGMRSNGRIYVVVAVMLTILFGLIVYVVRLDRKISRLEKDS